MKTLTIPVLDALIVLWCSGSTLTQLAAFVGHTDDVLEGILANRIAQRLEITFEEVTS